MAKITRVIFLFLLLLQGVLSDAIASPADEKPFGKPVEDASDDSCEPDDIESPDTAVPPSINMPPPVNMPRPSQDPAEEALPTTPFKITTEQILQVAPKSESCETTSPEFADECRTAPVAAQYISDSFERYNISSWVEQAAVLSWMAMESGEFRYSRNHFPPPGNPGQGTYNVQSFSFNLQYINATPELQANLSTVDLSSSKCGPETCTMLSSAANDALDMILQNDQYAFATGAWFMKEVCSDDVKASFANDPDKGWEDFVKNCVYTTLSDDRRKYWDKAKAALSSEAEDTKPVPEEGKPNFPGLPIPEAEPTKPVPEEESPNFPGLPVPEAETTKAVPEEGRPNFPGLPVPEAETTKPVTEEGRPNFLGLPITAAPVATAKATTVESGTVLAREVTRDSSGKPGLLTIPREEFDKFKDAVDRVKNGNSGLEKRIEDTTEQSLRQRDFSGFLDVTFGNRKDTICTEPNSEPSNEEKRAEMSVSTLSLIETIASCSGGNAQDKAICENLPSSFLKQPSPLSLIDSNTTLTYNQAYLSTLWLNLYALRPTKMQAPSTKKIFNNDPIKEDSSKNNIKPQVLHASDLIQCTYLSSLQELGPSSSLVNKAKRSTPSTSFTHRRHSHPHHTTHLRHRNRTINPRVRMERQRDAAYAERVAVITRWVDDTCAAGVREELYSEEDMARWCDEVGKAVRADEGAVRALETFEGWVEVI